jgi:hypothetical protein
MRPAFSSTRQAAAFAVLMLVVLLSPVLAGKKFLPAREENYTVQGWSTGAYPWIRNQIFEETNAIDIAFVGSSHLFNDIDTPYVQAKLGEKLGRPAVVRTIAWGGAGYDGLYLVVRDLLAHRRVGLLVFYDENPVGGNRNNETRALFRFGDDAPLLAGLPFSEQAVFYCAALMGMPRNLLSLVRNNLPAPLISSTKNYWELVGGGPNPVSVLGCLYYEKGFGLKPPEDATPFVKCEPVTAATPADALVFSPGTATNFEFSTNPLPAWQSHFTEKLAELLRKNHQPSVMLHLPVLAEVRAPVLEERANWPAIFGGGFNLLGIVPARMFGGLPDDEVRKLFGDPGHLNRNGQKYFTRLVTPALMDLADRRAQ